MKATVLRSWRYRLFGPTGLYAKLMWHLWWRRRGGMQYRMTCYPVLQVDEPHHLGTIEIDDA